MNAIAMEAIDPSINNPATNSNMAEHPVEGAGAANRKSRGRKLLMGNVFTFLNAMDTSASLAYHRFVLLLLIVSIVFNILATSYTTFEKVSFWFDVALNAVFFVEYILLVWSCKSRPRYRGRFGRLKFMRKFGMLVDLISLIISVLALASVAFGTYATSSAIRSVRIIQLFRILRRWRQQHVYKVLTEVLQDHSDELAIVAALFAIVILIFSVLIYFAETKQPDSYVLGYYYCCYCWVW
eukprot:Colp12_sorted_trinity150504_noHs@11317